MGYHRIEGNGYVTTVIVLVVGLTPTGHVCLHVFFLLHRSAYSVLIIIMGSSCSRCEFGADVDELPKPPVRQPSDGEVKVKLVDNLSSVRPPDGTEHEQEAIHVPVSVRARNHVNFVSLAEDTIHSSGVNVLLVNANSEGVTHACSRLLWLARMYCSCMAELLKPPVEQRKFCYVSGNLSLKEKPPTY